MYNILRLTMAIWILCLSFEIACARITTPSAFEIVLKSDEGTIRIWVSAEKRRITVTPDHYYYGYYMNKLFCKQGELEGKPLNGKYSRYDQNDNILESGSFKYGLKDGLWKQLTPQGRLTLTEEYHKGALCGERIVYINGKPGIREKYRNGILTGKPISLIPNNSPNSKDSSVKKKKYLISRLLESHQLKPPTQGPIEGALKNKVVNEQSK